MKEKQKNSKTARVLIVDDMPINNAILSSMLTSMGISCDLAQSGPECLDMCKRVIYDMVFLDHRMPGMDGVETLSHLKEIFTHTKAEIPVICHTADEGENYTSLYKAAGFADVLVKPVDPEKLTILLSKYLPGVDCVFPSDVEKKKHIEKELSTLPSWIKSIPQLDLKSGIEHCDTADAFLDALLVFTQSINEKAAAIEQFERDENWPMYLLRIHSLKSVARLIGANSISVRAADLEYAGSHKDYSLVRALTPVLIDEYKSMIPCYEKLISSKDVSLMRANRTVLFIGDELGVVGRGIIRSLEDEGFNLKVIPDVPEVILNHRADSNILIYHPTGDNNHIKVVSTLLTEMCRDDGKVLCLAGEPLDIATAQNVHDREYIASVYPRPVNLNKMTADISEYYYKSLGNDRVRTILLIDDDPDFLYIMKNWLSSSYNVDCSPFGANALAYLDRKRPDLILLDYEMPGMNGDQVMKRIRSNPANGRIPIIFLTGMNDKDRVMQILGQRPDGYLLKSMPREELLDSLKKFFA